MQLNKKLIPLALTLLVGIGNISQAETVGRITVEPELLWVYDSGAPIYGDSVANNQTLFLANTNGTVSALNKFDGSVQWQFQTEGAIYSGVTLGETGIYVQSDDGFSYKIDTDTGALVWRAATPLGLARDPLLDNVGTWDYNSSAPVESEGRVYVGSGTGLLTALDAETGMLQWAYQADGPIRNTPWLTDEAVLFGTFGGSVVSLDRLTGSALWIHDTHSNLDDSPRDYSINSPVSVYNGTVYVGTRSTYLFALDLTTGALQWMQDYYGSWAESPVSFYDNTIYTGSSFLRTQRAFVAATGEQLWFNNRTYGLSYSRVEPTETALFAGTIAVPGIYYDGFLVDGGLLKLDRISGEKLWFYPMSENLHLNEFGVLSSPIIEDTAIYFGSLDGNYFALKEVTSEFPIVNFSVDRDELKPGEKTTLRWNVIDDHVVRLNGRRVANIGHKVIKGRADRTYTLSVDGRLQEEQTIPVYVKAQEDINVAKYATASATSVEADSDLTADKAIDSNLTTRWASVFEDGASLTVDLGNEFNIGKIVIYWEGAYALVYHLETSLDGSNWTTIYTADDNPGGINELSGFDTDARYVRLVADQRATPWGNSIFEIEIYENKKKFRPRQCKH